MDANEYYFTLGLLFGEWHKDVRSTGLRFGQYVLDSERIKDIVGSPNPEIFYETDENVVIEKLMSMAPCEESGDICG